MNKLVLFAIASIILWIMPSEASAHVLLRDTAANIGAIVHINPDDDPVAGEETQMYIDIQDAGATARIPLEAYDVFITPAGGDKEQIQTSVTGNVIEIKYIFRTKGLYALEVVSKPSYETFQKVNMSYALRVSRGDGAGEIADKNGWAEALLPASMAAIALLSIVGWSNRKEILARSKF